MSSQHVGDAVATRFFLPSPALAPYVSTYYLTEVRGRGRSPDPRRPRRAARLRSGHGWRTGRVARAAATGVAVQALHRPWCSPLAKSFAAMAIFAFQTGDSSVSPKITVAVRFYPPPDELRRYFTSFYHTDIAVPPGERISDSLHPEWGGLRFFSGGNPIAGIAGSAPVTGARFIATGPTSRNIDFEIGACRIWGIGLLPLGWARFVRRRAADRANLVTDGDQHPDFAQFAELADRLCGPPGDVQAELAEIIAHFRHLPAVNEADAGRILAIHAAMIDPEVTSVTQLVERVGASQRAVERDAARHFGFSPKQLLRRQRFMRSLAQFMLDPSLKWIGAMDWTYHDQAQFVRDFHEFMGQTPREYAAAPHPILDVFTRERARVHGAAVQTLDKPEGASVPGSTDAA